MLVETPPESMELIDVEALKSHVLGLDQEVKYIFWDFFIPDLLLKSRFKYVPKHKTC